MYSIKLHNLLSSTHIIRVTKSRTVKWAGHVAHRGPSRRRDDKIITGLKDTDWEGVDWINLAQDRVQ
jgi:hypothetical protein